MVLNISQDLINNRLNKFLKHFQEKRDKKGNLSFNSPHEILGSAYEEFMEFSHAVHANDDENAREELLDIMVVAFWGLCSLKVNKENK